ncbi:MAG TPA: hypothetical protein DDW30_09515 [Clostridiales bacterium]|nr:hypothetical protein [Clostridiales bacterium]
MRKNKRLRIALLVCGGVVLLAVLTVVLLSVLLPKDEPTQPSQDSGTSSIRFYPPYDGDIRTAEIYTRLDRQFYLYDANYGSTDALSESAIDADPELRFLRAYFNCLIDGDAAGLRALLASDANGFTIPDFAQQMVYDMKVTRVGETEESGDLRVTYRLEYRIQRNNGTYRRDVGSDAMRPEYLTLTKDENGDFRIFDIRR